MISLTDAFLSHGATAYPCGKIRESRKMLDELPVFREVKFASSKTKLRSTLTKGTTSAKTNTGSRE